MLRLDPVPRETWDTLQKIAHRARDGVSRIRARVICSMLRVQRVSHAAREAGVSPAYARKVIRAFQDAGLEALGARHGGGRPRKSGSDQVQALTALTNVVPSALGLPWTEWSVAKLREYACTAGILPPVGAETLRYALHRAGIRYQRTKTWKESNDPLLHEKYCRIKALYEHCPAGAAVICVDEFGPLELRPYKGQGWRHKKHPQRLPATYHRPNGVRHFLAYYDVQRITSMAGSIAASAARSSWISCSGCAGVTGGT